MCHSITIQGLISRRLSAFLGHPPTSLPTQKPCSELRDSEEQGAKLQLALFGLENRQWRGATDHTETGREVEALKVLFLSTKTKVGVGPPNEVNEKAFPYLLRS